MYAIKSNSTECSQRKAQTRRFNNKSGVSLKIQGFFQNCAAKTYFQDLRIQDVLLIGLEFDIREVVGLFIQGERNCRHGFAIH